MRWIFINGLQKVYSDGSSTFSRIWNDIYYNEDELDGGVGIDMSIFNVKKKDTLNGSDVTPGTSARPQIFFTGTGYNTGVFLPFGFYFLVPSSLQQ